MTKLDALAEAIGHEDAVKPPNHHDAYFRDVMTISANAASQLRAVLPKEIVTQLDWRTLRLQSGSFISDDLRSRYTDTLYSAKLDGRKAFIYLLIEHQSTIDKMMPLRMLQYVVDIWSRYAEEHPKATKLPAIIPLVVHNNNRKERWTKSTELTDLIDLDQETLEAFRDYLPHFRFLLDDVAAIDPETLRARDVRPAVLLMLMLQRSVLSAPGLGPWLTQLLGGLLGGLSPRELRALVTYLLRVGEMSTKDLEPIFEQLDPQAKEVFMTTAEQLRAEGAAKARAEECAENLIQVMTAKFGVVSQRTIAVVNEAGMSQLKAWFGRAMTANSVEDVFAH
ncbi:Rpn family recombination-promoting nuclease/putative transposase [Nocardia panacis]|uniref:Rpn family recombination-promoting nuclease/putative transposase n=1 Tax=Nocardia panacis TaxID=2340916 RepID=A0A3A4JYI6_9NOCA|nr:Rpn family recombination-promoting nuclease/putative transposase [Nocardia panacis]RJO72263.1 Rpn family recombination-promoting nuclease/putative transposase [Nocardia panacis]